MRSILIAEIHLLNVEERFTFNFFDCVLSNQTAASDVINMHFITVFGPMAMSSINPNGIICYSIIDDDSVYKSEDSKNNYFKYQSSFKLAVSAFDLFLWFVKDTSVFAIRLYGIGYQNINDKEVGQSSTAFTSMNSDSTGQHPTTTFTVQELEYCKKITEKVFEICPTFKTELQAREIDYTKDDNRIEKALKFIMAARSNEYLRAKMAMYMSALECLFSTAPGELTIKVGARTGYYIGANKEERLEIFNNVQDAYDIRSKYLHGGEPNNKMKKKEFQVNLSIYIDNLLRRVLTKVILEDSAIFLPAPNHATPDEKGEKSKAFDKFLKELIF